MPVEDWPLPPGQPPARLSGALSAHLPPQPQVHVTRSRHFFSPALTEGTGHWGPHLHLTGPLELCGDPRSSVAWLIFSSQQSARPWAPTPVSYWVDPSCTLQCYPLLCSQSFFQESGRPDGKRVPPCPPTQCRKWSCHVGCEAAWTVLQQSQESWGVLATVVGAVNLTTTLGPLRLSHRLLSHTQSTTNHVKSLFFII